MGNESFPEDVVVTDETGMSYLDEGGGTEFVNPEDAESFDPMSQLDDEDYFVEEEK